MDVNRYFGALSKANRAEVCAVIARRLPNPKLREMFLKDIEESGMTAEFLAACQDAVPAAQAPETKRQETA